MIEYTKERPLREVGKERLAETYSLDIHDLLNEEWRDIKGYEGYYQVSNMGRVKCLPHPIYNGKGWFICKSHIMKPNVLAKGYFQLRISDKNFNNKCYQVHRLVALAFISIPNPKDFNQINHINGNKQDNRVENLEWCNNSLNQLHAWRTGLQKVSGKAGKPKRKVVQIDKETNMPIRVWNSIVEAVHFFGKGTGNIQRVLHKKPHAITSYGYKWKYYDRVQ